MHGDFNPPEWAVKFAKTNIANADTHLNMYLTCLKSAPQSAEYHLKMLKSYIDAMYVNTRCEFMEKYSHEPCD